MKKVLCTLVVYFMIAVSTSSFAQLRKIPAEVTDSFAERFPNASGIEWRDRLSGFAASFSQDSVNYIASFNNKGEWESTEEAIDEEELPTAVQDGFQKSKYAEWSVGEVSRIELPEDEIQFKLVVSKGDIKKRNLYFNNEGRMLKDKLTL